MREDVVDKVLKRDLPSLYKIRNATELERIFLYLCNVPSENRLNRGDCKGTEWRFQTNR